jgi:hypothetical protein
VVAPSPLRDAASRAAEAPKEAPKKSRREVAGFM